LMQQLKEMSTPHLALIAVIACSPILAQ
jgi:hypothetical protein